MRDQHHWRHSGDHMRVGGNVEATGGGARNVLVQTQRSYSLYMRAGEDHTIELLRYIDATAFVGASLIVRLHQSGNWPAGASVTVQLQNVSPAPDDPGTLFVESSSQAAVSFGTASAPDLEVGNTSTPIAGYLRCVLTVSSEVNNGAMDFTIGVSVVGRDG